MCCSEKAVYYHIRNTPKRSGGGAVAKTIPAIEIHKPSVEEEKQNMAEQNAKNACVVLNKVEVSLVGSVGRYVLRPNDGSVCVLIERKEDKEGVMYHNEIMNIDIKDIADFIEELKGVCRCAQSFDLGNAMW